MLWRYYDLDAPPLAARILAARPVSEAEVDIAARVESVEFWRALDTARGMAQAPTTPRPLPPNRRIERPGDGSAVVWDWSEWPADIVGATVALSGAGGGGASGEFVFDGHVNGGVTGGTTRLAQGALLLEASGGGEGRHLGFTPSTGAGALGGPAGLDPFGTSGAGGDGHLVTALVERGNGDLSPIQRPSAPDR